MNKAHQLEVSVTFCGDPFDVRFSRKPKAKYWRLDDVRDENGYSIYGTEQARHVVRFALDDLRHSFHRNEFKKVVSRKR